MRQAHTYRQNRRRNSNYYGAGGPTTRPASRLPMPRLNRSDKWPAAKSYADARIQSGVGTPVR